jgi:hypothetical protein
MRLLRSITRRGFDVGTAGWFTVLKPNTWFPASRLPGSLRLRNRQPAEMTMGGQATSPRILLPSTKDRRVTHSVLVVVTACAITSALLWWIMHP